MDEEAFRTFLRRGGRSPTAAARAIALTHEFETYLDEHGVELDGATPEQLESFVASVEAEPRASAKLHLWGINYYYQFVDDPVMEHVSRRMRRERVEQTPFRLDGFRGVSKETADRLGKVGIKTVDDLLESGTRPAARLALSRRSGVPIDSIEELVRLSDLARIGGVKGIRARLYLDAGIRSVAEMARWDPDDLLELTRRFVVETGFDGIAPLPREAEGAVMSARKLGSLIEW